MADPTDLTRREFLTAVGAAGVVIGDPRSAIRDPRSALDPRSAIPESQFVVRLENGAIVSLKRRGDAFDTDYVQTGRRLGDAIVRYWQNPGEWKTLQTVDALERVVSSSADGATHDATYRTTELQMKVGFTIGESRIDWRISLENLSDRPLVIGDLALPLMMNSSFQQQPTTAVLKHCLISGHGSFLFWMRRNSVGPYLTMTPDANTHLEYWESQGGYRVFVHSAAAGEVARAGGTKWRQPNTSLTLAPRGKAGASKAYGFALHWAADYDGVRQILFDEGLFDVHVVPGMTVPSDLSTRFALRTKQRIRAIEAEFPSQTTIKSLGPNGDYQLYEIRFSKLGENRLTVRYGDGRHFFLEFFSTEPIETLIAKRAAFIASHQHRDATKWYNGLLAEWSQDTHVMLSPDNYDRIRGWRIYEVTCDDPGLSKPAFLSSKLALFPTQSEVSALDYYIEHFVWGGLQRTTEEEFPYAIYGIPDWKQNRESSDPGRGGRRHLWRIYDYPHIALLYYSMYLVARDNPQITTLLRAQDYLKRAYGTAIAMFTVPYEIERWSAYQTGLYNELIIVDLIDALDADGLKEQADRLRMHWERKVRAFITDRPDLFRSEYAFDSTGFESTHALARYAVKHADRLAAQRPAAERMPPIPVAQTRQFLQAQMDANIFCRGWIETAYYYLGSDYRGSAGNGYCLTYMSQMGGWSVLDYALHHATTPEKFLRLGYASYLSAWCLMNTGTAASNYGYWYPGQQNDGAAGGGFEPAPFGNTWLEQPHHRGSWYYSCEIDLGFCGALRGAATVLADDPIFGRFCFGGDWRKTTAGVEILPKDGVRRRFHALIAGKKMHVSVSDARFARGQYIAINESLSGVQLQLESDNPAAHTAHVQLTIDGRESVIAVAMNNGKGTLSQGI